MTQSKIMFEVRQCLFLAVPLAMTQLAQSATGFVDTLMMGLLGSQILAAGGLGATAFTFLLIVATGIVSAVSPLVAEAYGSGNSGKVSWVVRQGLWLATLLSIPLTMLVLNATPLLRLMGQAPEMIPLTQTYLNAIAWSYFPALGFVALRSFVAALSKPRPVMVIVVIGTAINILTNYTLMFGKFGFPALGLAGIGWASTLSFWSMFLILIGYILREPFLQQYHVFHRLHQFERRSFLELLQVGLPIGGMIAVEGGLFSAATFLIGQLGVVPLAAHQIALQSASISFNVPLGISFATTIRVGQLLGQQNFRAMRLAGFVGIGLGTLSMAVTAFLFWTVPQQVVGLFLDVNNPANTSVIELAKVLLGVAAVFQLADGAQVCAAGALRGLKDTRIPMLIAVFAYWGVGLSSGMFLARSLNLGSVGLWWGLAFGLMVAAVILTWRFGWYSRHLQITYKSKPLLSDEIAC